MDYSGKVIENFSIINEICGSEQAIDICLGPGQFPAACGFQSLSPTACGMTGL